MDGAKNVWRERLLARGGGDGGRGGTRSGLAGSVRAMT